jgi:hypothetical protein
MWAENEVHVLRCRQPPDEFLRRFRTVEETQHADGTQPFLRRLVVGRRRHIQDLLRRGNLFCQP